MFYFTIRVKFDHLSEHPVIPRLILQSPDMYIYIYMLNTYPAGRDGKTGDERWRGKKRGKEAAEFGELIHFKLKKNTFNT